MSTAGVVAAALGSAVGSSLTIFPLTYIAAKRLFDLPPFSGARRIWAAYFGAQVVTTLLVGVPKNDPISDIPVLVIIPALVSLTVLFFYSWARSAKSRVGTSDRINYRRGLLRIWVLLTLGWSVYVLAVGGLQRIRYAWRYQFDYEALRHEAAARYATPAPAPAPTNSAQVAAPAPYTLEDAVRDVTGATSAATLRNNMQFSVNAQPDKEASYKHLGAAVGVPTDTVRAQPDAIKTQAALQQFPADDIASKYPETAKILASLDNTRMLHDDVPNMAATNAPDPAPEPPDWVWLEWLLLLPTVGVAVSVTALTALWHGFRNLLRWVQRGFVG
ncbi:hypothetical protein [Dyella agri]|uniref:Large polyvalent protein associated domain-containing protein n=1 Tax=Dyella agri TaxID=1926869 RepID=A0ABW8KLI5_9GAMM